MLEKRLKKVTRKNSKKRAILCFLRNHFLQKNCPRCDKKMHQKNIQPLRKVFHKLRKKVKIEIKELLDELSKEKEEESCKESRNEKLEKLKVDDLRVDEKLFKKSPREMLKILKNEKILQKTSAHDGPCPR